MFQTRTLLFVASLMAVVTPVASAQRIDPPPAGSKLRVWTPLVGGTGRVQGWLRSSDSASLSLRMADSSGMRLLWTQVDSMQISLGHRRGRAGPTALKGALIVGGILGLMAGVGTEEGEVIDPGAAAGVAFVFGGVIGGVVGALVGASDGPERWKSVSPWNAVPAPTH